MKDNYTYAIYKGQPCRIENYYNLSEMRAEIYKKGEGFVPMSLGIAYYDAEIISEALFKKLYINCVKSSKN